VDLQDNSFEFELMWDEELEKVAASQGMSLPDFKLNELQIIQDWQKNKGLNEFELLYNNHRKMIDRAGNRYMRSMQLPKAAVRSNMLSHYIKALETFDPTKGAALSTHVTNHMQHTGRYLQKYQNVGKIASTRTQHVGEFNRVLAQLTQELGRSPSTPEIADEMMLDPKEIEILRREIRKDLVSEAAGGQQTVESSRLKDRLTFAHGSLTPQQQTVLEYTEGMYGRPALGRDAEAIGRAMNISPQKVRAVKKQIWRTVERYY